MSAQHTSGPKPWGQMTDAERADAYFDASLRVRDIEWYRFHGIDPRSHWDAEIARGLHAYHAKHGAAA